MEIEGYTYIGHRIVSRQWGPTCQFTFARTDGTHINGVVSVPTMTPSNEDLIVLVSVYLTQLKAREDLAATYSNMLDGVGPEIKEAVFWLIAKIRKYPTATIAQAETQWNLTWADGLFTFDRLVSYVQNLAGWITWDQFKTYVTEKKFEGLD